MKTIVHDGSESPHVKAERHASGLMICVSKSTAGNGYASGYNVTFRDEESGQYVGIARTGFGSIAEALEAGRAELAPKPSSLRVC